MIELPDVFNGGFNGTPAESELRNEAARMLRKKACGKVFNFEMIQ